MPPGHTPLTQAALAAIANMARATADNEVEVGPTRLMTEKLNQEAKPPSSDSRLKALLELVDELVRQAPSSGPQKARLLSRQALAHAGDGDKLNKWRVAIEADKVTDGS